MGGMGGLRGGGVGDSMLGGQLFGNVAVVLGDDHGGFRLVAENHQRPLRRTSGLDNESYELRTVPPPTF